MLKKPLSFDIKDISKLTPEEIQSLVEELKADEAELSLQIEELKHIQEELQHSRDKYQTLYDSVPVGYFSIDKNYAILEANATAAKMLGTARVKLLQTKFTNFIAPTRESQDIFHLHIGQIRKTGSPKECDLDMQGSDGKRFLANLQTLLVADFAHPVQIQITVTDITERKKAEKVIQESESSLKLLWNTMSRGIVYQDAQGKVIRMNPAAEKILGRTPEHYLDKSLEETENCSLRSDGSSFPDNEHPSMIALKTGQKINDVVMGVYNPREKAYRWINISAVPLFLPEQNKPYQAYIIFDDITERKQAEEALAKANDNLEIKIKERTEQLQEAFDEIMQSQKALKDANKQLKQYANKITQVQEEERKRIAYELHDDTAQYLGILKMQIGALADSEEVQNPKIKERLRLLEKDADRAFQDVRRYSHELRPVVLEHQGLAPALEQIAEDYNKLGQFSVDINIEGTEPELSEEVKLGFFRVAQEALNNCRKHAKASYININLRFNHQRVKMIVSDNGEGFNVREALKRSGGKGSLGLMSMQERTDQINADLKIESELGKGTRVILKAKL